MERKSALKALQTVLKTSKNAEIIEKNVYNKTKGDDSFYKWAIYQITGLLLQKSKTVKQIGEDLQKNKIGWESSTYDNISQKIKEYDDYLVNPFEVVQGVVECPKCGSRRTWNIQKQTRSSDEPFSTFSRCVECSYTWVYSG